MIPKPELSNNLAASAASLKKNFTTCEKIITEKHQFLVAMLDGMRRTISTIADKLDSLETHPSRYESVRSCNSEDKRVLIEIKRYTTYGTCHSTSMFL